MTIDEVAARFGVKPATVGTWARQLGIRRSRTPWRYDFSEADVETLRNRRSEMAQRRYASRVATARKSQLWKFIDPEKRARHNREENRKSQARAWDRQQKDYYGCVVAFDYRPSAVEDPRLSSKIPGGPIMATIQWRPFYPVLPKTGDNLSAWSHDRGIDHISVSVDLHDGKESSESAKRLNRMALQAWYAHSRALI